MSITTGALLPTEKTVPSHRRRRRTISAAFGVVGAASFLTLGAVAPAFATEKGGSGASGGACKVTSGANAGKTGTYTTDDDGATWCEGSWGGTECTPVNGVSKCSAASVVVVPPRTVIIAPIATLQVVRPV